MGVEISRRAALLRLAGGLVVVSPMGSLLGSKAAYAYQPCDQTTWKLVRAYCQGPDWTETWKIVDRFDPTYECETVVRVYPDHPNCREDEEAYLDSDANQNLVAVETEYTDDRYAMLRARTDDVYSPGFGPENEFTLVHLSVGNPDTDSPSSLVYAIQSNANGLYVSTEVGYSGDYYDAS